MCDISDCGIDSYLLVMGNYLFANCGNSKKKKPQLALFKAGCQYWQISSLAFDIDNFAQYHTYIVLYILVCDISDCGIDSNFGSNGKLSNCQLWQFK